MDLHLKKTLSKLKKLLSICILVFYSLNDGLAEPFKITLPVNNLSLAYPKEIRLSTLLNDAYGYSSHEIYSLGSTLVNPAKQSIVDKQKANILAQLKEINTPASSKIANQLTQLYFSYREDIETDIHKVRTNPKLDPIIKSDYELILPKRPEHILMINSHYNESLPIPIKANFSLKDYIVELSNTDNSTYDNTWIIQANRDVYQAKDFQWKNTLYFLTPGAIVFVGLTDLPKQYQHLNADIANLLTFNVEL